MPATRFGTLRCGVDSDVLHMVSCRCEVQLGHGCVTLLVPALCPTARNPACSSLSFRRRLFVDVDKCTCMITVLHAALSFVSSLCALFAHVCTAAGMGPAHRRDHSGAYSSLSFALSR
jgi:hypothetical protein